MKQKEGCSSSDPSLKKGITISSSGVNIMSSMTETTTCCDTSDTVSNPSSEHEKPGYKLCSYVDNFVQTDAGLIPIVKSKLGRDDLFSTVYVRCGIHRHQYTVAPGIYGIGNPDRNSEVLVTANFKLTFDHLRKELNQTNAWILVLDTKGVNVWCAAGKGTFATAELVDRIKNTALDKIVDHRRVIVPQLGATGVSAKKVKEQSGFRVVYGPVRANDIPAFLASNKKADKKMRQVTFTMVERLILTPVEIQIVLKPTLITALVLVVLSGIGPDIFSISAAIQRGTSAFLVLLTGIISGAFLTPVLLPYIPFRTFALKGMIAGSLLVALFLYLISGTVSGISEGVALFLFSVSISSYLAMNFTGTTPYTSPSGVEKEMKRFIPVQLGALIISTGLWIYSAF